MSNNPSPDMLQYNALVQHLTGFVENYKSTGRTKGYSYSIGPRKIEINDSRKGIGMVVNELQVMLFTPASSYTFPRYLCEEEYFQSSCTGEIGCDETIELLIKDCFEIHFRSIVNALNIGGWNGVQ
jgi:hypothetical protein